MTARSLYRQLAQLDELKNQFGPKQARRVNQLLNQLSRAGIDDPDSLIQLHESLMFLCAYPHNSISRQLANKILGTFPQRIKRLVAKGLDLSTLEHPETSGIAGMTVTDTFTFPIVRWLIERDPGRVDCYWEWFDQEDRLAESWPRVLPLLEEDSYVEANVPYRTWLQQARGGHPEVEWLIDKINRLERSDQEKAELYNSQHLFVRWRYLYNESRTGLRGPRRAIFFHHGPLVQRRDINFIAELNKPAPPLQKLSAAQGKEAIDTARLASTVRYRELYGFTNGSPRTVFQTSLGRGVELVVIGLPADKRLPLRAYHAATIYKNGVPVGYFEGLSLFERMESGFNLYYTFREGETAWLYARVLNVMHHLTGVSAFSLDPYQIGFENEEGIASGAFWFYRKLGFHSTRLSIRQLTKSEEEKIASRKNYRTPVSTLRRLAEAPMILELGQNRQGDWDHFQVRNIGLAVQRLMARNFAGQSTKMRNVATASLARILRINPAGLSKTARKVLSDFAVVFLLLPDLKNWDGHDKALLSRIIEAKATGAETQYLKLMQKHHRLRAAMIKLGSHSTDIS